MGLLKKIMKRTKDYFVGLKKDIVYSYPRIPNNFNPPYKLHIGCGGNLKKGWMNIDLKLPADCLIDVKFGLPVEDNSSSMVYSEHFLEHLSWPDESIPFLQECFRVIQKNGSIRIGVPDSRVVVERCLKDLESFKKMVKENDWKYPEYCKTSFEYINYHFRIGGNHKFAYDFETLSSHLSQVGFSNIIKSEFIPSIDSPKRASGTLYVTAIK